jgi:hypothetical protein
MEKVVVLSTNNNPDYYMYLPYQLKAWHNYGWKVCVIATHDVTANLEADYLIYMPPIEGTRSETVAQSSRLYAANFLPEYALIMTCDMDLIPLSDYWHPDPSGITVYGHDLTDYSFYPMGYVAMTGKRWKECMNLSGDTLDQLVKDIDEIGLAKSDQWENWWNHDWTLLTKRLSRFKDQITFINRGRRLTGTFAYGRVDRGDSMQIPPNETLIDAHCENFNTQDPEKLNKFRSLFNSIYGDITE